MQIRKVSQAEKFPKWSALQYCQWSQCAALQSGCWDRRQYPRRVEFCGGLLKTGHSLPVSAWDATGSLSSNKILLLTQQAFVEHRLLNAAVGTQGWTLVVQFSGQVHHLVGQRTEEVVLKFARNLQLRGDRMRRTTE